jgi:hypothetical protein
MRWSALLVAWMLSVQAFAPAFGFGANARPACCCADSSHRCHCPGCDRQRAVDEGCGAASSCGATSSARPVSTPVFVAPAVEALALARPPAAAPPYSATRTLPPPVEVPTPPPLA